MFACNTMNPEKEAKQVSSAFENGFYIARTFGQWEYVNPFGRVRCASLQEAVEYLIRAQNIQSLLK